MPEPILLSATAVTVAAFAYKAVKVLADAPTKTIKAGGESIQDVATTVLAEFKNFFQGIRK
jgi:hypothetical protein